MLNATKFRLSARKQLRKAQSASSAAVLVIIIAAVMVLYVLVLPPDVREELLNDGKSPSGSGSGGQSGSSPSGAVLLSERVGTLTALSDDNVEHELNSLRIFDTTQAQVIKELSSIYVRRSIMSMQRANISFSVDPETSSNLKLAFNVKVADGRMFIYLNNEPIATLSSPSPVSPPPIAIPHELLRENNVLTFEASGPGIAVWRINEFLIEPVTVVADVTDVSALKAEQSFSISSEEAEQLDTATLFFLPECTRKDVAPLEISMNGRRIFKGVPDCGARNNIELDVSDLSEGKNTVEFETQFGNYLIDRIEVKTTLKEPISQVYYFDISASYFTTSSSDEALCGEYDSICPSGCSVTRDPDCCFEEHTYWCTVSTTNVNDRCVDYATTSQCGVCPSGYQDESGDVPEPCENKCGDDDDGVCPAGCSILYDEDCCFAASANNYWCNEAPLTGVQDKCTPYVGQGQCASCPSGYFNDDGKSFSCPEIQVQNQLASLLSRYDINMTLNFAGDNSKKLDAIINNRKVSIDTNRREYSRLIDTFVVPGTNTIELVPRNDVEVTQLSVRLKQK